MKNITKFLFAIVIIASWEKAMAVTIDPTGNEIDTTNHAGGALTVEDTNHDGGSVAFTDPADATLDIQNGGVVKVGTVPDGFGGGGTVIGKTGSGTTAIWDGSVLEITDNTANCIAGALEVNIGGKIKVDDGVTVPVDGDTNDQIADSLILHDGAIIQLGANSTWTRDVIVTS